MDSKINLGPEYAYVVYLWKSNNWKLIDQENIIYGEPEIWFQSTYETIWTWIFTFANSVDPDKTARNVPYYQDLYCLQFWFWFVTKTPTCIVVHVKIKEMMSTLKTQGRNGWRKNNTWRLCYLLQEHF